MKWQFLNDTYVLTSELSGEGSLLGESFEGLYSDVELAKEAVRQSLMEDQWEWLEQWVDQKPGESGNSYYDTVSVCTVRWRFIGSDVWHFSTYRIGIPRRFEYTGK